MRTFRTPALLLTSLLFACSTPAPLTTQAALPIPTVATVTPWTVQTIAIPSVALKHDSPAIVVLPASYAKEVQCHYPVVYLLHGAGDNDQAWTAADRGHAAYLAEKYQVILVCPNAKLSWYFNTPRVGNYATYVGQEVPAYIDAHFRTIPKRGARAIAGLSMGGHGAMWLGMHNPSIYGAIGSMSGGVDVRPFVAKNAWGLKDLLGNDPKNWEAHSVLAQVPQLIKPGEFLITMDCGTEDFFLKANRALHQCLLDHKIPHIYTERPGHHNWAVWRPAADAQLLTFSEYFKNNGVLSKN